ncbi:hypothetical protein QSH18_12955 [Xanthomonas sp. NCPPB 2654]|uniref:2'-5' RNA ligase family protein n=1 Tax=unclassified Xanthomonas TaxID=2643310 RepID=UPI0021E0ECEA|nr:MULTISPECIES: hypothetical protein [unclassified Xanthomonas]MDL5366509.1 hypothetical protein [Xanthomonas sp. NCPPB 2654]UYC21894.1 hypothetical protein NUG20_06255 [Xanthomonas sp. CFBP 8443]
MSEGLIVMARPPAQVRHDIGVRLDALALDAEDAHVLVAPANWHQSLSDKHPMACRENLMRACEGLVASSVSLAFDRIVSGDEPANSIHWTLKGRAEKPPAFADLLDAVKHRLNAEGIADRLGHTAHVTLSYFARRRLDQERKMVRIAPIAWTVDRIELVAAGGKPYGYRTLMQWPLLPPRQAELF